MPITQSSEEIIRPILDNTALNYSVDEVIVVRSKRPKNHHLKGPGSHRYLRILAPIKGQSHFVLKNRHVHITAGDIAILPCGLKFKERSIVKALEAGTIALTGAWADQLPLNSNEILIRSHEQALHQQMHQAIDATFGYQRGWDWALINVISQVGALLSRPAPNTLYLQVVKLISNEPEKPWGVPELAIALKMSLSSFSHRFKDEVGMPPARWVRKFKIALAKDRLQQHSVGEVAFALGFNDQFHFSRVFKQETGMAPSTWKRHSHIQTA